MVYETKLGKDDAISLSVLCTIYRSQVGQKFNERARKEGRIEVHSKSIEKRLFAYIPIHIVQGSSRWDALVCWETLPFLPSDCPMADNR
jgi:hypothetical protein